MYIDVKSQEQTAMKSEVHHYQHTSRSKNIYLHR